ncbi:unnamed protein product [Heterobilharzia americana]|nr:unnamed protein product [Heterobilharzia americana]
MSMNKSNKSACLPANIYCEHTYDRYKEEGLRLLEKYMPYLNPETGLRNRMITRDPVTGLGDLEAEWNPLNGCHINRKTFPYRDPIRMEGDMGTEYNCLYTTKELTCKSRVNPTGTDLCHGNFYEDQLNKNAENHNNAYDVYDQDRDPITLQGDLGEEIDVFRPHGGKPKNRIENNVNAMKRDPISGTAEGGRECESIHQYNGRQCNEETSKRYSYLATDPITHSLPETKLVRSQSVRHYKEAWSQRDPIGYMHRASVSYKTDRSRGLKHFSNNKMNIDPITHQTKYTQPSQLSAEQTDETSTIIDNISEISVDSSSTLRQDRRLRRAIRNPITGEGMFDSDYIDLLKLPSEYYFRRNRDTSSSVLSVPSGHPPAPPTTATMTKKVTSQREASVPAKPTANKPTPQPPVQQPPQSKPPSTSQSKPEAKVEKNGPQAVEKKVVRPKKVEMPEEKKPPSETAPVTDSKLADKSVTPPLPITETNAPTKDTPPEKLEETVEASPKPILPQLNTEKKSLTEQQQQQPQSLSEELKLAASEPVPSQPATPLKDDTVIKEIVEEPTPPIASDTPPPVAETKPPADIKTPQAAEVQIPKNELPSEPSAEAPNKE